MVNAKPTAHQSWLRLANYMEMEEKGRNRITKTAWLSNLLVLVLSGEAGPAPDDIVGGAATNVRGYPWKFWTVQSAPWRSD